MTEETFTWGNCKISHSELEATARNYADNYWYDKANFNRPESPMQALEAEFGSDDTDPQEKEQMLSMYLDLCGKYRNEFKAKYEEAQYV